jgi:hypothetical protein
VKLSLTLSIAPPLNPPGDKCSDVSRHSKGARVNSDGGEVPVSPDNLAERMKVHGREPFVRHPWDNHLDQDSGFQIFGLTFQHDARLRDIYHSTVEGVSIFCFRCFPCGPEEYLRLDTVPPSASPVAFFGFRLL